MKKHQKNFEKLEKHRIYACLKLKQKIEIFLLANL